MSYGLEIANFNEVFKHDAKIMGVMVGIVTKNDSSNDEEKPGAGRIKVKIPLIGMAESNWARIASFMAGNERGAFFLPEVGDEVLVIFENGDPNKPYIIGSLWNGKDLPPETNKDGKNDTRIIKSRSGHTVQFFDKKDEEKICIKSSKGHLIQIDDKKDSENIQIVDKSGNNKIIINTKDNKISINANKDIEICSPKGNLSINAKNINMKASGDVKIEASSGMNLKSSANMVLKGSMVNIN